MLCLPRGVEDELLATCWTFAGNIDPGAPDPASPLEPLERIDALARHGFTGADFLIGDLRNRDLGRIRQALDDAGIRHRQVELATGWWTDTAADSVTEVLDLAAGIGATQVKAAADLDDPARPYWDFRDAWTRFADRAGEIGAQLMVEPLPFSNLPTIEEGARFVQGVGHPNAGIVVDYWHVVRGGSTLASLRQNLDPAHLFAIELCDGSGPKPVGLSMLDDANSSRELPGEGSWDVRGFVRAIREIGYHGPWGIEMPSPWYRTLPLDDALGRAASATRAVLK
jgi:sugar phosphate isomerase/epimerase